ncbi:NAD-dependent epimerase/dehydratase family protein [Lentzea sp. NPDC003310]|uniref:NAD-dependent epimerase/dehydratase family protein n=1 Tax=Lentzea sp. NPDC003310 TaxID=3154447 RepID=UPI0033A2FF13
MRLAVTGATGFVGGAVCRAAEARGWRVHAYGSRSWDIAAGPLTDPPVVDAVVHCAAAVTDWGSAAEIRRVNVVGTRNVLETFPGARFVHMSSASVYDPFRPTVSAVESAAPVGRYLTAYGATKAEAEGVALTHPDSVVLRPHAVYGPGDPTLLPRVLSAIRGRTLFLVGDGQALQSLTSIDNLAHASLLACTGRPGVYNVADAAPVVLEQALRDLLRERGLDVRIRYLPLRLAWSLAAVAEPVWRLARRAEPPRLTRYAISHLAEERTLDITAARTHLGYEPAPTSFAGAATW